MATDLHELTLSVVLGSGKRIGETAYQLDNQDALLHLVAAVEWFNGESPTGFTLATAAGAERAFVLDRVANPIERRVLVLMALLIWLDGSARGASFDAVKVANQAGSTNLTGIEFALSKRAKELWEREMRDKLELLQAPGVVAGMGHTELGETHPDRLGIPNVYYPNSYWPYYP